MSASRIVIPRPSELRRWRFEYRHARTHDLGRREAVSRAARVVRAARRRRAHAATVGSRATG